MKCLIIDDEPLACEIIEGFVNQTPDMEVAAVHNNALSAFEWLKGNTVDLVFLDIQMPEIDGIQFLKSLENPPSVIFTTAYSEFAATGFELDAVDYLLKPIAYERFLKGVNKAKEYIKIKQTGGHEPTDLAEDHLFVKANQKLVKVFYNEIKYVEAFADYVKIFIPDKRIVTLQTMKKMENILPDSAFCRVHRSYIVGLSHITAFNSQEVTIDDVKIPIGKNYRDGFLNRMKSKNIM